VHFYVKKAKKSIQTVTSAESLSLYCTSIKKRTVVRKPILASLTMLLLWGGYSQDMAEATTADGKSVDSEVIAKKNYVTQGIGEQEPPTIDGVLNDPV